MGKAGWWEVPDLGTQVPVIPHPGIPIPIVKIIICQVQNLNGTSVTVIIKKYIYLLFITVSLHRIPKTLGISESEGNPVSSDVSE